MVLTSIDTQKQTCIHTNKSRHGTQTVNTGVQADGYTHWHTLNVHTNTHCVHKYTVIHLYTGMDTQSHTNVHIKAGPNTLIPSHTLFLTKTHFLLLFLKHTTVSIRPTDCKGVWVFG